MNTTLEAPAPVATRPLNFAQRAATALYLADMFAEGRIQKDGIEVTLDRVAEVIEQSGIDDSDVLAFVVAKGAASGIKGCVLSAYERSYSNGCAWIASVKDTVESNAPTAHGDTADEAIFHLKVALSSEARIKEKRERAAKLLAEAEALEARGGA